MKILLVEDKKRMAQALCQILRLENLLSIRWLSHKTAVCW